MPKSGKTLLGEPQLLLLYCYADILFFPEFNAILDWWTGDGNESHWWIIAERERLDNQIFALCSFMHYNTCAVLYSAETNSGLFIIIKKSSPELPHPQDSYYDSFFVCIDYKQKNLTCADRKSEPLLWQHHSNQINQSTEQSATCAGSPGSLHIIWVDIIWLITVCHTGTLSFIKSLQFFWVK